MPASADRYYQFLLEIALAILRDFVTASVPELQKINLEYFGYILAVFRKSNANLLLAAKFETLCFDTFFKDSKILELCPKIKVPAHKDKSKNFFFM